jgi:diguanylate cyclase (GGDEF)-like protein
LVEWGGEEFALVISDIPKASVLDVLEKLREKTAQQRFPYHGSEFSITVSIGLRYFSAAEQCSADQLLHEADKALAQAKKTR